MERIGAVLSQKIHLSGRESVDAAHDPQGASLVRFSEDVRLRGQRRYIVADILFDGGFQQAGFLMADLLHRWCQRSHQS